MKLVQAKMRDLDRLERMVADYHAFEDIHMTHEERMSAISPMLKPDFPYGFVQLLYKDELLVGYIALTLGYSIEFGGMDAFVDEFFLIKSHRNQGLGGQALLAIQHDLKKRNVRALHLEVASTNERAIALYKRCNMELRTKYHLMTWTAE